MTFQEQKVIGIYNWTSLLNTWILCCFMVLVKNLKSCQSWTSGWKNPDCQNVSDQHIRFKDIGFQTTEKFKKEKKTILQFEAKNLLRSLCHQWYLLHIVLLQPEIPRALLMCPCQVSAVNSIADGELLSAYLDCQRLNRNKSQKRNKSFRLFLTLLNSY